MGIRSPLFYYWSQRVFYLHSASFLLVFLIRIFEKNRCRMKMVQRKKSTN